MRGGERDKKKYKRLQLAKRRIGQLYDEKSPNVKFLKSVRWSLGGD